MSIVHVDKIWVEIAKKFEMRTSGGGGGGGVISDFGHPRTRGGGGVKKGKIFADVLYGWPLIKLRWKKRQPFFGCKYIKVQWILTYHLDCYRDL